MTNAPLKEKNRKLMGKLCFLFGDSIQTPNDYLDDRDYKRLCQVRGRNLFLTNMEISLPFIYPQSASIPRTMNWHLSKA